MKIILDGSAQQDSSEQQQFVIIGSQSLAGKSNKMSSDDNSDGQEEVVYVLKDENASESSVIQLDSNCVNQEQFVWIANEQGGDSSSQVQSASTLYTIKELNYAQVREARLIFLKKLLKILFPGHHKLNPKRLIRRQQRLERGEDDNRGGRQLARREIFHLRTILMVVKGGEILMNISSWKRIRKKSHAEGFPLYNIKL